MRRPGGKRNSRPAAAIADWRKTPVEDVDLGHGVHMLENVGGNIGVLAGKRGALAWWVE